jgi:hypothetical protein
MSPKQALLVSRYEQTTKAANAIVEAQRIARDAKTARLRKARLTAQAPVERTPEREPHRSGASS